MPTGILFLHRRADGPKQYLCLYLPPNGRALTVTITDITGRELLRHQTVEGAGGSVIDVENLSPGVYLYKVTEGTAVLLQGKLSKQ